MVQIHTYILLCLTLLCALWCVYICIQLNYYFISFVLCTSKYSGPVLSPVETTDSRYNSTVNLKSLYWIELKVWLSLVYKYIFICLKNSQLVDEQLKSQHSKLHLAMLHIYQFPNNLKCTPILRGHFTLNVIFCIIIIFDTINSVWEVYAQSLTMWSTI